MALAASFSNAEVVIYKIDPVHSGVDFKIRHFINKVPGTFGEFEGEIHFDKAAPENSKAVGKISVASVDTRNSDRDAHLQNEDFFKTAEFPAIEFTSTQWKQVEENRYHVTGDLTMLGTSKPVTLDLTFLGEMEGRGVMRSGWVATTTIDRTDWGITYGRPAIGSEVEIELNIQAHRQ
jgi:polyisoprenoid-binding protein YceI